MRHGLAAGSHVGDAQSEMQNAVDLVEKEFGEWAEGRVLGETLLRELVGLAMEL
jgi:NOL1/NOP2/fmu family ribosome biogenesis protein